MNSASDNTPRRPLAKKALGKGLSTLLPSRNRPVPPPSSSPTGSDPAVEQRPDSYQRNPTTLPLEVIHPNPNQPRTVFHQEGLEELAASIAVHGIIQPLIVRRSGHTFEIIAGERRWRAAKLAEQRTVPVVILEVADDQMLEIALIENIQREDLNPIEAGEAFLRLSQDLGLSQEEIGRRTGKDRTTIANLIRLLKLAPEVQQLVAEKQLTLSHAKAILGLQTAEEQIEVATKAAERGLSVRQVETRVQEIVADREPLAKTGRIEKQQDPNVRAAAEEMERALGTRVRIVEKGAKSGKIEIDYFSPEELERLYEQIMGESS